MASAWDQLLDLLESTDESDLETTFAELAAQAQRTGDVDAELGIPGVARWLNGLVAAHRAVRAEHPEINVDTEVAELRRIVTRWLHPARPR